MYCGTTTGDLLQAPLRVGVQVEGFHSGETWKILSDMELVYRKDDDVFLGGISPGHKGWSQTLEFTFFFLCKQKSFFVAQKKGTQELPGRCHTYTYRYHVFHDVGSTLGPKWFHSSPNWGAKSQDVDVKVTKVNKFTDSLGW